MVLDPDAAYKVLQTHDARFDGRLFVGVTSTRVYCRPVCRVRLPQRKNCRFYVNAASAERDGFRPCLRCRPEQAPGLSLTDSPNVLAQHAARLLNQAAYDGDEVALPEVAARLGVTDRHLRRIFLVAHGVTPIEYLTTQRLLLAKQLLTDSALKRRRRGAGRGLRQPAPLQRGVRRALPAEPDRLAPRTARHQPDGPARCVGRPSAAPGHRPPYDIDGVVAFFGARALAGVEAVDVPARTLRRTLAFTHQGQRRAGWLALRFLPERREVEVVVSPSLASALGAVVQRLRQCLDLDADPAQIDTALARLPGAPGVRVPNGWDGFEIAVRVILGQQVTVAAARTLTRRLVDAHGEPIATPFADLTRLFPCAERIARATPDAIGSLGIVRQRVGALQALARELNAGRIALHRAAPLAATLDALRALPGIGEWTVQLIAMRALAWPDAFPASDIGLMNALGTRDVKRVAEMSEAWRPWRSYAVMRLWQTLETGT